jgi:hypothetical protein
MKAHETLVTSCIGEEATQGAKVPGDFSGTLSLYDVNDLRLANLSAIFTPHVGRVKFIEQIGRKRVFTIARGLFSPLADRTHC